jgi:prolyl oligopeptidase
LVSENVADLFRHCFAAGHFVCAQVQPPKQQQMLVTLASADALKSEKVVLDPNKARSFGKTAIDWFVPSRDGKYVAMSISQGGSEDGTLHIYETATGKTLKDSIAHVQYPTAGGSAAWNADGTGIYYTRFPRKGDRPDADLNFYQQVYFHKIGTADSEDTYSIGKDFPRIAEIKLEASYDGKYILATVANGDGGDFAHYLLGPDRNWKQLTQFSDQIKAARIGRDGRAVSAFAGRRATRENFAGCPWINRSSRMRRLSFRPATR